MKRWHIVVVIILATCFSDTSAHHREPTDAARTVTTLHGMSMARAAHSATTLSDGRVLLAGGFAAGERALQSAELFAPARREFVPTMAMHTARFSHTATLLQDGTVLVVGGYDGDALQSAERYDPRTEQWSTTGSLQTARSGHTATILDDGRVLVVGGVGSNWSFLASAEVYDPQTGTFALTGAMRVARESHTATLLSDGRVLVAGGHSGRRAAMTIYASAERYDPATGVWNATGVMAIRRHKHDATALADGTVLVTGGADERDSAGAYRSAEIYDVRTGTFEKVGAMTTTRYKHQGTSMRLPNGAVLVVGGGDVIDIYDPAARTFCRADVIPQRMFATAVLVGDGHIVLAGGYGRSIRPSAQAWMLDGARIRCR